MSAPVRAVLFDYGMVLTGPANPAAWERMRAALAMKPDAFHRAYWLRRHDYDRGALTGEAYWHGIAAAAGVASLDRAILERLLHLDVDLWTDINPLMLAWAQELQRRGFRTGILSNLGDLIQKGVVGKLPWIADFHHATWSHTLGIAKPDPSIYRHAAEGLGTSPESILFLDDRADNIAAARTIGMQAIQFVDWSSLVSSLEAAGLASLLPARSRVVASV